MKIAVLWQMAVIPFGHEMTPQTFSSKVKVKEAVILKVDQTFNDLMLACSSFDYFFFSFKVKKKFHSHERNDSFPRLPRLTLLLVNDILHEYHLQSYTDSLIAYVICQH